MYRNQDRQEARSAVAAMSLLASAVLVIFTIGVLRPAVDLSIAADVSDSNNEQRRQAEVAISVTAFEHVAPRQVSVTAFSDKVQPLLNARVLEPSQLISAIDRAVKAKQDRFGTYLAPTLIGIAERIRERGEANAAVLICTDGSVDDPDQVREAARVLAQLPTLRALWVAGASAELVNGVSPRAEMEKLLAPLGRRLMISSSPAETEACLRQFTRQARSRKPVPTQVAAQPAR